MGELRKAVIARSLIGNDFSPNPPASTNTAEPLVSNTIPPNSLIRTNDTQTLKSRNSHSLKPTHILKGHSGWIWDVEVDSDNDWFATASADNTIKVWSLAEGKLKLTLTNHKLAVRCLAISSQMPYMFSGGEDQSLLCWDLEHNKPTRHYHGHRSGIYTVALHPEIPHLLASGSRDSSIRLWDVRTRAAIRVLNHDGPVNKILMQSDEPQLVSASQDRTVKLWDIISGRCTQTLTHHTNSVRALAIHPLEYTFVSGARDSIKQWKMPEGYFLGNLGTESTDDSVLSMVCDESNNLYVGYESGIKVFNYSTGEMIFDYQLDNPVLSCAIDRSRSRLITGHMDQTVRLWNIT